MDMKEMKLELLFFFLLKSLLWPLNEMIIAQL